MKKQKGYAIICWVLSTLYFLSTLLISKEPLLDKQSIFHLAMGGIWLFLGVIHWVKGNKNITL